jgi:bacteriocin-like protein
MEILIELTEDELSQIAGGSGSALLHFSNTAISPTANLVSSVARNFASHTTSFNFATLSATAA